MNEDLISKDESTPSIVFGIVSIVFGVMSVCLFIMPGALTVVLAKLARAEWYSLLPLIPSAICAPIGLLSGLYALKRGARRTAAIGLILNGLCGLALIVAVIWTVWTVLTLPEVKRDIIDEFVIRYFRL